MQTAPVVRQVPSLTLSPTRLRHRSLLRMTFQDQQRRGEHDHKVFKPVSFLPFSLFRKSQRESSMYFVGSPLYVRYLLSSLATLGFAFN